MLASTCSSGSSVARRTARALEDLFGPLFFVLLALAAIPSSLAALTLMTSDVDSSHAVRIRYGRERNAAPSRASDPSDERGLAGEREQPAPSFYKLHEAKALQRMQQLSMLHAGHGPRCVSVPVALVRAMV